MPRTNRKPPVKTVTGGIARLTRTLIDAAGGDKIPALQKTMDLIGLDNHTKMAATKNAAAQKKDQSTDAKFVSDIERIDNELSVNEVKQTQAKKKFLVAISALYQAAMHIEYSTANMRTVAFVQTPAYTVNQAVYNAIVPHNC